MTKIKEKRTPTVPPVALLLIVAIACCPGCGAFRGEPARVKADVLDCTKGELANLPGLIPMIMPQLGIHPDWGMISAQLEQAGVNVATCVLADLVDRWSENLKLATPATISEGQAALAAMQKKNGFREVKR